MKAPLVLLCVAVLLAGCNASVGGSRTPRTAARSSHSRLGTNEPGDERARIQNLNEKVYSAYKLGLLRDTLSSARDAVTQAEQAVGPDDPLTGFALFNLGRILLELNSYTAARPILERALAIFERALGPDDILIGHTLSQLAQLLMLTGDFAGARPLDERALRIRERRLGRDSVWVGWSCFYLGRGLGRAGMDAEARPYFARAIAIADGPARSPRDKIERLRLLGLSLHWLALLQWRAGERAAALPNFERGLAAREQGLGRDHPQMAYILVDQAWVWFESGNRARARAYYERALDIAKRTGNREGQWQASWGLGRIHEEDGQLDEALSAYRESVQALQGLVSQFEDQTARERFLRAGRVNRGRVYDSLARVLLKLNEQRPNKGFDAEAWAVLDAKRGRVVAEALTRAGPSAHDADLRERSQRVDAARARLADLERAASGDRSPESVPPSETEGAPADVQQEITTLLARTKTEYLDAVRDLLARYPRYKAQFVDQQIVDPRALARFADRLPHGTLAVQYFAAPDALYVFVVAAGGRFQVKRQAVRQSDLYAMVRKYREYLERAATRKLPWTDDGSQTYRTEVAPLKDVSAALASHLLGPIGVELAQYADLVLIPNDLLLYVAMHALPLSRPDGSARFLAATHTVSYVTQLEVVELLAPPTGAGNTPLLALANPDGSLPGATQEVSALAAIRQGVTVLDGSQATKEKFIEMSARFSDLHLATHGMLDAARPERSYLLMAGPDERSRQLSIREIAGLSLPPNGIAVLSACETAVGEQEPGAALMTLAAAFSQAGSQTVIASLWAVNDVATRDLMVSFYRALGAKGRAAALQEAVMSLMANPRTAHPYYWAPFILLGAR